MSNDGRFWLADECWGSEQGTDMLDAMIFRWRWCAERELKKLDKPATTFEIGLYNGKPVMLVDAYHYWIDAKYTFTGKTKPEPNQAIHDDQRFMPPGMR